LHYGTLLGSRACAHMAAAAWASAFLNALLHTANTFSLPLCHGNALGQFFCEIPQILKLSCSHSYLRELGLIAVSSCLVFGCFVFIVFSYVQIFRAVLRIPSEQGRHKAFSTCLPHLAVVSLFICTAVFAYLKPPSISSPSLDLALSVLYSVVPPVDSADALEVVDEFLEANPKCLMPHLWPMLELFLQVKASGVGGSPELPRERMQGRYTQALWSVGSVKTAFCTSSSSHRGKGGTPKSQGGSEVNQIHNPVRDANLIS
ncbi:olfactory receptor 14J1-like, partial [Cinclus cinclus]|uniref:olfactory receptor 14J1-like n=1 Tax=Cinclus cinclus TaxID=127875 RepID=UPI002E111956